MLLLQNELDPDLTLEKAKKSIWQREKFTEQQQVLMKATGKRPSSLLFICTEDSIAKDSPEQLQPVQDWKQRRPQLAKCVHGIGKPSILGTNIPQMMLPITDAKRKGTTVLSASLNKSQKYPVKPPWNSHPWHCLGQSHLTMGHKSPSDCERNYYQIRNRWGSHSYYKEDLANTEETKADINSHGLVLALTTSTEDNWSVM